jgi:hypothetical protein
VRRCAPPAPPPTPSLSSFSRGPMMNQKTIYLLLSSAQGRGGGMRKHALSPSLVPVTTHCFNTKIVEVPPEEGESGVCWPPWTKHLPSATTPHVLSFSHHAHRPSQNEVGGEACADGVGLAGCCWRACVKERARKLDRRLEVEVGAHSRPRGAERAETPPLRPGHTHTRSPLTRARPTLPHHRPPRAPDLEPRKHGAWR